MSQSRKRASAYDGDSQDSNKSRGVAGSRPLRPVKKRRTDDVTTPTDNPTRNANVREGGGGGGKAKVRQVWTATAIEAFSEGLCQHGKNFHRILKFMQTKYRKKKDPVIPNLNKDQVRFYYYRTWHKVSALLTDPTQPSTTAASDGRKSKLAKSPSHAAAKCDASLRERTETVVDTKSIGVGGARGGVEGRLGSEVVVLGKEETTPSNQDITDSTEAQGVMSDKTVHVCSEEPIVIITTNERGDTTLSNQDTVLKDTKVQDGTNGTTVAEKTVFIRGTNERDDNTLSNRDTVDITVNDGTEIQEEMNNAKFSKDTVIIRATNEKGDGIDCSPHGAPIPKFESIYTSSDVTGRHSPVGCALPSPPDCPDGVCEGEGVEVVTAVMSEEEEGLLNSSVEDLPPSPPIPFAPLITATTETDVEIKAKENSLSDKVVSRRDSVRGDTVVVNGARHCLDLVALIAYFKLKKKCQADHNFARRLSELVYLGCTTIPGRTKGGKRKVQIKLRNCRALQSTDKPAAPVAVTAGGGGEGGGDSRSNECPPVIENPLADVEAPAPPIAPATLTLELRPLSSSTWRYVQSLSQNPRLRMTVASSLTLGQLQSFLISKWQLVEEEGSEAGDDGSCHSQRLKLYHTHHDSIPTFRNEQPLHPTSLYTSKLDPATASSSTASACTMSTSARVQDRGAQTGLVRIAGNSGQQKSAVAVADSLHQCDSSSNTARCMCLRQEQSDKNSIPVSACSYTCGTTAGRTSQHHSECESHRESREGGGEEGGSEGEGSRDRLSVFVHSRHSAEGVAKNTDFHLDCPLGSYARKIDVKAQSTLSSIHLSLQSPETLQLLYEVVMSNVGSKSAQRLRNVLKMATALVSNVPHTSEISSPLSSSPHHHTSPVVADYMRSLPLRRSPWRSPLIKYRRLKQRSPRKHISPRKLNFSKLSHGKEGLQSSDCSTPLPTPSLLPPLTSQVNTLISLPLAVSSVSPTTLPTLSNVSTLTTVTTITALPKVPTLTVRTPSPVPSLTSTATSSTVTPSLSHLLTTPPHESPLPLPSHTVMPLRSEVDRTTVTTLTAAETRTTNTHTIPPSVQLLTVPKASVAQFNTLNLQSLFSVASSSLESGHGNTANSRGVKGRTHTGSKLGSKAAKFSSVFGLANNSTGTSSGVVVANPVTPTSEHVTCVSGAGVVSTRGNISVHVTTPNTRVPKPVSVQVVNSVQPRSSVLPPSSVTRQQPARNTQTVLRPQIQILSSSHSHTAVASSRPAYTSTTPLTSTLTVAQQGSHNGLSSSTLDLLNSMRKSKRHKTHIKKTVPARQIVPRPLPFGLPTIHTLSPSQPSTSSNKQGGSAPSATDAHNSHVQQQLITLLQSLVAQHQQRKQQQQQMMLENQQQEALFHSRDLSSAITQKAEEILKMQTALPLTTTRAMSAAPNEPNMTTCVTTSAVNPASTALTDIPESDVQAAILDNLFATTGPPPGTSALNSTRLFQTSSDTVDQLLRGLSVRTESDSIQKLSQDTASVLPTFARALESSMGLPAQSDAPSTPITAACGSDASIRGDGMRGDGVRGNGWRDDGVHTGREVMKDCVRFGGDASPESEDSQICGGSHSTIALSDVLAGSGTDDSTFQQLARNGDLLLEGLELPVDTLSQLPATPPRQRVGSNNNNNPALLSPPASENDISIGSLLDFLVSPEKDQNKMGTIPSRFPLSHVDSTYRSLFEETSVDYIHKFREIASQMNTEH